MGISAPVGRLYDQRASELDEFRRQLEESLSPEVYAALLDWVWLQSHPFIEELGEVFGRRTKQFEEVNAEAEAASGKAERKELQRRYYEIINPAPIARELSETARIDPLAATYDAVLSKMQAQTEYGALVERFHLPSNAVRAVLGQTLAPLEQVYAAIEAHAASMREYFELLKKQKGGRWKKVGARVAAGVAGSVLGGPFGGFAAREGMRWLLGPSGAKGESRDVVWEGYDHLQGTFFDALEEIEQNLHLGLLTLYGGMLLRVDEDLALLDEQLGWVNFHNGKMGGVLRSDARGNFIDWAEKTLDYLEQGRKYEHWTAVANSADAALTYALKTPGRCAVTPNGSESSYVLLFARQRAFALSALGDEIWQSGNYVEAARAYGRLLNGCSVAAGQPSEQDNDPYDEVLVEAGWRIALVATSSFGAGEPQLPDADTLPVFVAQALARFPYGGELCAGGERIGGKATLTAKAIGAFIDEPGDSPRYARRLPRQLKDNPQALAIWAGRLEDVVVPMGLLKHLSAPPEPLKDARFYRWLRSQRTGAFIGAAIVLLVILLLLGGLVWGGWALIDYFSGDEETPAEPAATKKVSTAAQEKAAQPHRLRTAEKAPRREHVDRPVHRPFRKLDQHDGQKTELFRVVCPGTVQDGPAEGILLCDQCPAQANNADGPLKLHSVYAGRRDDAANGQAVLAMTGCSSFNSRHSTAMLDEGESGKWRVSDYRTALASDNCETLYWSDSTRLFCQETLGGQGSAETHLYLLNVDNQIKKHPLTVMYSTKNACHFGGVFDAALDDIKRVDVAGDGSDELVLLVSYRAGVYLAPRDTSPCEDLENGNVFTVDGKTAYAFAASANDVAQVEVEHGQEADAQVRAYTATGPPLPDVAEEAYAALQDSDETSALAYRLYRRRLTARHNLQQTSKLEELVSRMLALFPKRREQILRDLLRACFDASDEGCVQRTMATASSNGFDFTGKLSLWKKEASTEDIPPTPHKLPREWQEGSIPTGDLTKQERLRGVALMGRDAHKSEQFQRAEALYIWAINTAKDADIRRDLLLGYGKILEEARSPADALRLYDAMRRLEPNDPDVLNRLAWFLLKTDDAELQDSARAKRLATKAVELTEHKNPSIIDTLAEYYIQEENFIEARSLLETCRKLDPLRVYYQQRLDDIEFR